MDNDQSVMRLVARRLAALGLLLPNEIVELNADVLVDELHRAHVSIALVGGTTSAHTNGRRAGVIEVRQRGQLVLTFKWRESASPMEQA